METFSYFAHAWDVTKAKNIVSSKRIKLSNIDVNVWSKLLQSINGTRFTLGISVDWESLKENPNKFDLTVPLIVVHNKSFQFMVIDGWHRIARANSEGILTLPAYCLSKKDSKCVEL